MTFGRAALAVLVLLCGLTMLVGFANKDRCTGPTFNEWGRSDPGYQERSWADACYSDIQYLWVGRDVDRHVFPYVHGDITPDGDLVGGSLEYPVLTGMLIWAGAFFVHTDAGFLLASAILLAPFGLLVAWLLGKMSRWRALLWSIGPPLVLYAFHNWDLPVVACAVGAVYVLHGERWRDRPLVHRATFAAVLLGIGFAVKIYPLIFVLPLALYVFTGGRHGGELPDGKRWNPVGALRVAGASVLTVLLVNLPFMIAGFDGWRASFAYQGERKADLTANSVWFWAFRPESEPDNEAFQGLVNVASPVAILLSFVAACGFGWWRYRREGSYPWIAVSAAMLCGFLLLHKVHSPQYTLWLVPMFVLLRVRWGWIAGYFLADAAMGVGVFRWFYALQDGAGAGITDGFAAQATVIGVWGRAALLVGLFIAFLTARSSVDDALADQEPALPGRRDT
ncbi:MAG: DUF2029 domain-containing protein [Pseudonocardiaceae bacterium]|nr:DUF2029 domain-containing protein [Pseudonocardiaceae bacterium]